MKLKVKRFEVLTGRPIVFLNEGDAEKMDMTIDDRIEVSFSNKKIIARIDLVEDFLKSGEVALSEDIEEYLKVKAGNIVDISFVSKPESLVSIKKKMSGKELSASEIKKIIQDVIDNSLKEVEIAEFVIAVYKNGMSKRETVDLTRAMFSTGKVLKWHSKVVADKHCIGGIAGNRTTPIVVSICAAAGIVMPKTSSRAITSAAGTADTVETLAKVDFPASELTRIVMKTGACLAWGGSLGMSPADDKLIQIERVLRLDPDAQLLASILSKKIAAGSTHVLIDIPYGDGAKVSRSRAEFLKRNFIFLGKQFGLKVEVILTDGNQPIGNGVGPVLEMVDVVKVLRRDFPPKDLEEKSIFLAGKIFELTGKTKRGSGEKLAKEMLDSGKAYKKFEEILKAQGLKKEPLKPAKIVREIVSNKSGRIIHIDNVKINTLATLLGCPFEKNTGIYLFKHVGDRVVKGDKLMAFYSNSHDKMKEAFESDKINPSVIIR